VDTVPLRTAADALRYWELKQQAVSNNLANAETPGFKAERVFARLLNENLSAGERTDLTTGALRETDAPLDVAIEGTGFLVVSTPAGERLTRGGALTLDPGGRITDGAGHVVLGDGGPILVPPGARITIAKDGTVRADDEVIDQLRVETVAGPDGIEHEAAGLFRATNGTTKVALDDRSIHQGFIEESNVSTLDSMVEMITIQRSFASVQGSLRTMDSVMDTIANRIGRVG
jgi:flagellar basal-body rod protein FlgF